MLKENTAGSDPNFPKEFALGFLSWGSALLVGFVLIAILSDIVIGGMEKMTWDFLSMESLNAGRSGGIGPVLLSTLYIIGVAVAVAYPVSIATALFLSYFTRQDTILATFIRRSLDFLAGVPSIIFGLFGNAFFCIYLGLGFSILSGGLTLACMVLPLLVRVLEENFRSVPEEYRLGSAALGFSVTASVWYFLMPLALPGLVVGSILGFGRAIAETAALIFTSGYVDRWPESLMDSGRSLSIHIFDLSMNVPGGDKQAYGTSLVLIGIILLINLLTSFASNFWLRKKGYSL